MLVHPKTQKKPFKLGILIQAPNKLYTYLELWYEQERSLPKGAKHKLQLVFLNAAPLTIAICSFLFLSNVQQ
jgi:hypothetical protein